MRRECRRIRADGTLYRNVFRYPLVVSLVASLAIACGPASGPSDPVTISRFVTGMIVGVDSSGSAICLRPDAGGDQLCSIPLQRPGSPSLFVGQHVGVAIASIATGTPGSFIQVFVVYSPPPRP